MATALFNGPVTFRCRRTSSAGASSRFISNLQFWVCHVDLRTLRSRGSLRARSPRGSGFSYRKLLRPLVTLYPKVRRQPGRLVATCQREAGSDVLFAGDQPATGRLAPRRGLSTSWGQQGNSGTRAGSALEPCPEATRTIPGGGLGKPHQPLPVSFLLAPEGYFPPPDTWELWGYCSNIPK